ncbi:protein-tyrosine phosphatase-like protein [Chytriomyces cf. hyalinus JEL632]|nr:protein-tyrosine phosphatase-like protein [Chytriomyces cf. hyalinus JEL632]
MEIECVVIKIQHPSMSVPSQQDPAEILPGQLFLSSIVPATDLTQLQQLKITHILNVTGMDHTNAERMRHPNRFPADFIYHNLLIADEMDTRIIEQFDDTHEFISTALLQQGGRVLVHCEAGISRSSTIVIAFLVRSKSMTVRDALTLVQSRKNNIGPNKSFYSQLLQYEAILFHNSVPSLSIRDYLVEQMLHGSAMGFPPSRIAHALSINDDDPNSAMLWLFDN